MCALSVCRRLSSGLGCRLLAGCPCPGLADLAMVLDVLGAQRLGETCAHPPLTPRPLLVGPMDLLALIFETFDSTPPGAQRQGETRAHPSYSCSSRAPRCLDDCLPPRCRQSAPRQREHHASCGMTTATAPTCRLRRPPLSALDVRAHHASCAHDDRGTGHIVDHDAFDEHGDGRRRSRRPP